MWHSQLDGGEHPAPAEARLIPVLARALDLGRGPPGLVSWVRSRLPTPEAHGRDCVVARRGPLLRRLARELSRLLPQSALETIVGRGSQLTLRGPVADDVLAQQPAPAGPEEPPVPGAELTT